MATEGQQGYKMADSGLLSKIDQLFACNVGNYIDLPQLVVIGDQSSGKSSVLEGLTELPFPRNSGLCTRFATQIIFRRATKESINVSIIPAGDADQDHKDKANAWHPTVAKLDARAFADIVKEVPSVMGLSAIGTEASPTATFSSDVLRLEITSPKEEHLSVIDVPGIFKNTTAGVTTKKDIALVREMVQGYMKNPRSVMIAVVPANVDIATQEILEMAREVDPEEQRTIGVFTKPDLVDKGAETSVVDLVQGKGPSGKLGWSMVRNLSQWELDNQTTNRHDLEEQFFRCQAPWDTINKDRVGVSALRKRLQERLAMLIRREFPKVKVEISKKLSERKELLNGLGATRETQEQQAKYLLDLASTFQSITSLALTAQYGGQACFGEDHDFRLPTILASRNETFAEDVAKFGHEYVFMSDSETAQTIQSTGGIESHLSAVATDLYTVNSGEVSAPVEPAVVVRKHVNHVELQEILLDEESVGEPSRASITAWLEKTYIGARGMEMGTFNPALLAITMKQQSTKWEALALGYTSDVVATVHNYIVKLLVNLCPDENVRSRLLSLLLDDLLERYSKGLDEARFLLHVERYGTPQTLNHYFTENLEKCRQTRRETALESKSINDCKHGKVVRFGDLTYTGGSTSNTEHTVREMHDILRAYYKVARKRFVDNVCMQAADYYLVSGPNSPLRLFSPALVMGLKAEQLEDIAGEDPGLRRQRQQLNKEIKELEAGRKILM